MNEVKITAANFDAEVTASPIPVIVDFWASWCGPCRMLSPIISQIADEKAGKIKVGKVNVDEEVELAQRFGIMSIPTVLAFKDGKIDFDKYNYETTTSEELAAWQSRYDAFMVSGHLLRLKGVEQSPFVADSQAFDGVNPRSMIGVTSDRTVYMVVVDGRQSGKADGLTIPQMAQLAKYLGLVDAINLDGGGSSTLWVKGKGVINTPSGGSVRKVPNIIIAK